LRTWLAKNNVKAPKAPPFDFSAYLDGAPATAPPVARLTGPLPEAVAGLTPMLRTIVTLVGRRADDPELVDFVTNTLGQKVPSSVTDVGGSKNVVAKKKGIELVFDHDLKNEKYPLIHKSKSSYVPYLSTVFLTKKLTEPLPFGLEFGMSVEEVTAKLQTDFPRRQDFRWVYWELDPARDIALSVDGSMYFIRVYEARELTSRHGVPRRPVAGLFMAWAIMRDLIDEERFRDNAALLAAVRKREQKGSAFVDAALARGLWDIHLRDEPGLRDHAYNWFNNMEGIYIDEDLIAVFGAREGPYGPDRPLLDDDDWPAVDKATPTLDRRFAQWVRKASTKSTRK